MGGRSRRQTPADPRTASPPRRVIRHCILRFGPDGSDDLRDAHGHVLVSRVVVPRVALGPCRRLGTLLATLHFEIWARSV